jgi:disulfide bond formation protein DsbB
MSAVRNVLASYGLYMAWVVALVATLGSLYLSEIMLFEPCRLCWIQRIFMYPLAILLGIACFRGDYKIIRYALALSIPGGLVALYQYLMQQIPAVQKLTPCKVGVPCHLDYLDWYGWITIPLLALVAFALITIILLFTKEPLESAE